MENKLSHLTIIYVLLALLAAWTFYVQLTQNSIDNTGVWQCSNVVCSQSAGPEAWMQENCFGTPTADGEQVVCRVQVDGQNRLVPIAELNLTNLRVCNQYTCVQEVNVRATNYTVNVTQA